MVSSRVVLLVLPTSPPAATARRTRVISASPRRRSESAGRVPRRAVLGGGQRSERGLQDALALDVEGQPVLERPGAGVGRLGEADEATCPALLVLQHTLAPVLGHQGVPQHPAPGRAVLLGHRDQPFEDVRVGVLSQQRPQLVRLGDHRRRRPHRQTPGLHRLLHRLVDHLAERLRQRHHRPGPTGDRRRRMSAHPLGRGHRRSPTGGLTPGHRLGGHRHPRRVTGHPEGVDLSQEARQAVRSATTGHLPQHLAQDGQGRASGLDPLDVLRQAQDRDGARP